MKKIILLAACLLPMGLCAQNRQAADAAFENGRFAEALSFYQEELKTAKGNSLYEAQLRVIASQYMLGRYQAAAESAFTFELPQNPLWKARFLLYRTQTAQRVSTLYSPILPDASEDGASLPQLSKEQWDAKIDECYEQLWDLRTFLINAPIDQETLVLEVKDTDQKAVPTLFDFVVLQWKNRLLSSPAVPVPLRAASVLTLDYKIPSKAKDDAQKAVSLLAEAAELGGKGRADARIIWQAQRLTLPFEYSNLFSFENQDAQRLEAAQLLQTLSGYSKEKKGFLAKISQALLSSGAPYGKAYAAQQAAYLLNDAKEYEQAAAVCDWAAAELDGGYYAKSCAQFAEGIRAPVLNLDAPAFSQDPAQTKVSFTARNINQVYVRIYSASEADLKKWYKQQYPGTVNSWRYLTTVPTQQIPQLLARTPVAETDAALTYDKPHDFKQTDIRLPLPDKRGFYAVLFSYDKDFNPDTAPVQALVLNSTDLALFASAAIEGDPADYRTKESKTFTPNIFRIYALDLKTGEPVADADVVYYTDWKGNTETGKTNENGLLTLARKIKTNSDSNNNYSVLPKAVKGASTAFMTNALYFNYYSSSPFSLYAETDRAIYRPGQKVQLAVYGFEKAGRGLKTMEENSRVTLRVRDANYQKIHEKTLTLNAYGTARDEITLPEDGLLGYYTVETAYKWNKRNVYGHASFRVDEYKRPEYEITLADAAKLQYGKEASITGSAKYYFGAPLEKASVKYTVHRTYFRPPFWWWRPFNLTAAREFIAEGTTQTDKEGNFTIQFTPEAGQDEGFPSVFTVHAEVMDASGRVIETQHTYKASRQPLFFQASFDKGFYDANTESPLARIKLTDVNGQGAEGKFTAEIYELENVLSEPENSQDILPYSEQGSLEQLYGKNKELRRISKKSFSLKNGEEAQLHLEALPEGIYKLKLQSKNADDAELVFLVAEKTSRLALPAVTIAQQEKYYPGSQAKVLIGAQGLNGAKRVEVYESGEFLAARELTGAGAGVYSLPIQEGWRGGVYLRWFGASDYKFYTAQTFINVPFDNKELSLHIDVPAAVKPAEKVSWSVTAKNAAGAPVQGQLSARVYDKSLDYYASSAQSVLSLNGLYPSYGFGAGLDDSGFNVYATSLFTQEKETEILNAPIMPRLNLQPYFRAYGAMTRSLAGGAMLKAAAPATVAVQNSAVFDMDARDAVVWSMEEAAVTADAGVAEGNAENETAQTAPRTDFSETAYFNPMVPLQNGTGSLTFTMPESLTAWNLVAFALTRDANFGAYTAQTVTQKDIMVRLSLPRFWREGDVSTIVAQVTNLTDKKRSAEVTLDLMQDGQNAAAKFGVEKTAQSVSVPAGGTAEVTWAVTVPQGVGILNVTATVRAAQDSDAESRQLPLLPAKERLAESVTAALDIGTQTLKLDNLLVPDATREVSSVTLRVDPGLLLSVFNAMPQLLKPRHEDALSVADRYVPLSVVNGFYKTYPLLQNAVADLPKRDSQTPSWNEQDPARLMLLSQTPWLQDSLGGATREEFLTDLFNPSAVEKARAKAEKDLAKYQTACGGYSWMPGGAPSEFITLRLLSAYAEALRYGGQIPQAAAKKALAWLAPRIEKSLKESAGSASTVAQALYAAYVFTAFPQDWKEIKEAPVQNWLDYADQHARYMTPLGQTYAAAAYYRLGKNTKAQNYLDVVLSQMRTAPVTGSYFAPEAQSWLWYNDTLATQTATLRTLLEVRPESDKAQGLVKWLLFNRKAQAWDSSAATADAVYALLDYMKRNGLLDDPAEYTLQWGEKKKTLHFEPLDWSQQLAWTQQGQNVEDKYYTASVTKRGGLTGFVTLDAVYTTANALPSPEGVLNVTRQYLLKYTENGTEKVRPLMEGEALPVGSEVEVRLTLTASSAFDFVVLTDPKPAGFESTELLSGWSSDVLSFYRENRDAATNFFFDRVPAGTYTLRYTLRPTLGGDYHALPAQVQSMYAPEFSAHTGADRLTVQSPEK